MSIRIMTAVFERSKTRAEGRLVLLALADNASDEGECYPSIATIARKASVSEPTTREYLHAFEKIGLLTIAKRAGADGKQTSNRYTIHAEKIGDDAITAEVLASCRAPSKREKSPPTENQPYNPVIPAPSKQVIPTPSNPVIDESSLEPSIKTEEEEEAKAKKTQSAPPTKTPLREYVTVYENNIGYPGNPDSIIYHGICQWADKVTLEYWLECVTAYVKNNGHTFTFLERILTNGPRDFSQAPAPRPTTRPAPRKGQQPPAVPPPVAIVVEPEIDPKLLAIGQRIVAKQQAAQAAAMAAQGAH